MRRASQNAVAARGLAPRQADEAADRQVVSGPAHTQQFTPYGATAAQPGAEGLRCTQQVRSEGQ